MLSNLVIHYVARKMVFMLIGPSGSGKTTFARALRNKIENNGTYCTILSSDMFNDGKAKDAYTPINEIMDTLFSNKAVGVLIVDATCLNADRRKTILDMSRKHGCQVSGVVFNYATKGNYRPVNAPLQAMWSQYKTLQDQVLAELPREGFDHLYEITEADNTRFASLQASCAKPVH